MSFLPLLRELFAGLNDEITIEEDGGERFTGPVDEAAAFADECDDPWLDLITAQGSAIGLFVKGDHRKARLHPTIPLPDGMVYLFSNEAPLGHKRDKHWLSLLDLEDFLGTRDPAVLDDLEWYEASQIAAIQSTGDRRVTLMAGRNRQEKQGKWKPIQSTMSEFLDTLMTHQDGKKDGPCFLQGESAGGVRKAVAMIENHIIGIDLDSGAPLEDVKAKIEAEGLECVIYTTHSHRKDTSVVTRDDYFKKMDTGDVDEETCREYLVLHKGILPEIVEDLTIIEESKHTSEGIVIVVQHKPMPKFRAVFPLHEPYTFAERGGSQKDAIKDWKEVYAGFCEHLGLFYDPTCCDPARLFYLPRAPKGAPRGAWKIEGDPVNLDDYPRVKLNRRRRASNGPENAFTRAAGDVVDDDAPSRSLITEDGFDVLAWAKKRAKYFEIEDCLRDVAPDMIREDRGTKPGTHIECPFEPEHTEGGGLGTFVVNASDNYDEGYDGGFSIQCVHNACYDRDRLDFMKEFIEAGIITAEDLRQPDYYMDVEELDDLDDKEATDSSSQKPDIAEKDEWGHDEVSMMEGFNERYAVVRTPGGVRILVEPRFPGDAVRFETQNDVALYEKRRVLFYEGAKGKTQKVEAFKAWLEWDERRTYRTAVFDPGRTVADDVYNIWRGWAYEPKKTVNWDHPMQGSEECVKGDWSILRGHIYKNICEEDDFWFNWFMTWLSHIFQKPQAKPGSTVVITGEKGVGKSTLFDYVNQLLGPSGITVSQRKQIVGQFNGHLETTLLMVCEEAFWAADPQAEGVLKDMITNSQMLIERKGFDPVQARNFTRLALISNSDWVVPASLKDERRFGVFKCHSTRRSDLKFFEDLRRQMDELGGLSAMLYDLLNWVPPFEDGFACLFTPPHTQYLRQQQIESLSGIDKFMLELMKTGLYEAGDDARGFETIELHEDEPTQVWGVELRNAAIDYMRFRGAGDRYKLGVDDICPVATEWFNAIDTKALMKNGRNHRRLLVFPPLTEARVFLKENKGLDVDVMDPTDIDIEIPQ